MRWGAKKVHDLGGGAKKIHDYSLDYPETFLMYDQIDSNEDKTE